MSDINILRFFMEAKYFRSNYNSLPQEMFDMDTRAFLKWFDYYFKKYREDKIVDVDKLSLLMKLDKATDSKTFEITNQILKQLKQPIDMTVKATILEQLEERRLAGEAGMLLAKFDAGEEVDISYELLQLAQDSHKRRRIKHQGSWEDGDVYEMAKAESDVSGYRFTFLPKSIWQQIKGLNEGNNMAVAAPTNKGKTSFLCALGVCFAKQRKELLEEYNEMVSNPKWVEPDEFVPMKFRPVLYLINEGSSRKITPRIYQTAIGCSRSALIDMGAKGVLNDEYIKAMGRRDAIRCVNIHGMRIQDVIKIIEQHDPFLVITDMTGRIKDFQAVGANDVPQLENVWNTLREQAEILNFIHCGTVQISAEGFNQWYPPVSALQQSKTGIQTTWDFSFYIGALVDPSPDQKNFRGISTPKSKMACEGCSDELQQLVMFNPELNTWKQEGE